MRPRMLAFGGSTAMLAAFTFLTGCGGSGTNASAAIPDSARQKAQAIVTPLIGKPSEFPITEKLAAPVPAALASRTSTTAMPWCR